jgi:hypothetical protein
MRSGHLRAAVLAALAGVGLVAAAPARPAIQGVKSDLVLDTLTVTGHGFGDAAEVTLGGTPLVVASSTDDTIVAELPAGVSGMNHLLAVTAGSRSDTANVWIPGEGILTRGPILVESTESNVRVVAGGSRITVDPAGGVRIESTGPINLDAQGELRLKGNSVRIDSATSLRLNAGTTLDAGANGAADLHSAGTMTVRGAVINLN